MAYLDIKSLITSVFCWECFPVLTFIHFNLRANCPLVCEYRVQPASKIFPLFSSKFNKIQVFDSAWNDICKVQTSLLSKCKRSGKKRNSLKKEWRQCNAGQPFGGQFSPSMNVKVKFSLSKKWNIVIKNPFSLLIECFSTQRSPDVTSPVLCTLWNSLQNFTEASL